MCQSGPCPGPPFSGGCDSRLHLSASDSHRSRRKISLIATPSPTTTRVPTSRSQPIGRTRWRGRTQQTPRPLWKGQNRPTLPTKPSDETRLTGPSLGTTVTTGSRPLGVSWNGLHAPDRMPHCARPPVSSAAFGLRCRLPDRYRGSVDRGVQATPADTDEGAFRVLPDDIEVHHGPCHCRHRDIAGTSQPERNQLLTVRVPPGGESLAARYPVNRVRRRRATRSGAGGDHRESIARREIPGRGRRVHRGSSLLPAFGQ